MNAVGQTGVPGFLARFDGLRDRLPGDRAARAQAADYLRQRGWPTMRDEAWRYTNLRALDRLSFSEPLTCVGGRVPFLGTLPAVHAPRIVMVDGRLRLDLSELPARAKVGAFAGNAVFGALANPERDRMVALNTMLAEDGAVIEVAAGDDAGLVLLVSLASDASGRATAFHPRHAIRLGAGARLTLLEISVGEGAYLHNPVTEIHVEAGAVLTHVRLQDESSDAYHLSTLYADIAGGGTYDSFTLNLGGRIVRSEMHARLAGAHAATHLNGAQLLGGAQHSDLTTVVSHDAPNCASRQTVKNVLSGRSRGVFQGRIEVARIAQKTDGYQMNQALLLSPEAEIDCKPELRIFADDVKCSHGATVGELDAAQLFYLRSRGVLEAEARTILVRAFLAEAFDAIDNETIRGVLDELGQPLVGKAISMNVLARPVFNIEKIRADFPILSQTVRGKKLVFLDSAASAQKPRAVIDAMVGAMETQYANIHRGLHWMSERTTDAFEGARDAVAGLINAGDRREIIFTRNSTESINLVAHSFGRGVLRPGQAVVISQMEHHSNIVPWQMLRDAAGVELRIAPVTDAGELDMAAFEALLEDGRVGLVSVTHMSNVLGTYTPAERIVSIAHAHGAKVLFDGSQAVVHRRVDVQALGCDFYVFTGHKLYGPTGIGVLFGKMELLDAMPPFMGGGDMISSVSYEHSTWAEVPHKFEAGTPAILEGIGLKAAVGYVESIGYEAIAAHEAALTELALARLSAVQGVRIIGSPQDRGGVVSFTLDGAHAHDVATLLDRQGIAVRAGHHCAEPLMHRLGLDSTARASFGVYTTVEEIDALAETLDRIRDFFK